MLDLTGPEPAEQKTITVGTHPNKAVASADGRTLYVANGDSDEISVIDAASTAVTRSISLAPYRDAQVGSSPDALTLSRDGRTLYVANAGNNDVAVIDLASGQVNGLIPTGWYPTALVATDRALFITNGKGLGAGPNGGSGHPNPYEANTPTAEQYVGSMMVGTLSTVQIPVRTDQLREWTAQVARNDGFGANGDVRAGGHASTIVPRHAGERSPIQHVIYVVKENRTYDQVFGSLGKGNGDPTLNLFGRGVRTQRPGAGKRVRNSGQLLRRRGGQRPGLELDCRGQLQPLLRAAVARQTTPLGALPTRRRAATRRPPRTATRARPTSGTAWPPPGSPSVTTASTSIPSPTAAPRPPIRCSTPTPTTRSVASTCPARTARTPSPRAT